MLVVFGTRFCGKIATVNNQWVESKFFSIMFIPIFPVSSMFVTGSKFRKRSGIPIAIHGQSVKAVYGRVFSLIFAAWFLFLALDNFTKFYGNVVNGIIFLLLGIVCGILCGYFYLYYAKPTPEDIILRNKVGQLTGNYALPHWFNYVQLRNILDALELKYKQQYPENNWKTDLQGHVIERDKRILLFGLALFNCMVHDLPENDALYTKADQLFILDQEKVFA